MATLRNRIPSCLICLECTSDYEKDFFVNTERGHLFHNGCLNKYFKFGSRKCPQCDEWIVPGSLRKVCGIDTTPLSKSQCNNDYDYSMKVILLGKYGVGKSSLCRQFEDNTFRLDYSATTGPDFFSKIIDVGRTRVMLRIWDTAGQDRFQSITRSYLRGSAAIIFMYDITDEDSFGKIDSCVKFANEEPDIQRASTIKLLVGNKLDLAGSRAVPQERGEECALKYNMLFCEASVKDSGKVEAIFRTIAVQYVEEMALRRCSPVEAPQGSGGFYLEERVSLNNDYPRPTVWQNLKKKCF